MTVTCRNGHQRDPGVRCRLCNLAAVKRYAERHPDRVRASQLRSRNPHRRSYVGNPPGVEFWAKADSSGGAESCWPWLGNRSEGYGRCRGQYTHRIAYALTHGAIPAGMFVCHSCDNPPCVNPAHLWLGTNADNLADMWRKGRSSVRPHLTPTQVALIRRSPGGSPLWALAERLGVSVRTVYRARSTDYGRTWQHQGIAA